MGYEIKKLGFQQSLKGTPGKEESKQKELLSMGWQRLG